LCSAEYEPVSVCSEQSSEPLGHKRASEMLRRLLAYDDGIVSKISVSNMMIIYQNSLKLKLSYNLKHLWFTDEVVINRTMRLFTVPLRKCFPVETNKELHIMRTSKKTFCGIRGL
jgi:hypothetical protein